MHLAPLALAMLLAACGGGSGAIAYPHGEFQGLGENRLTLEDPRWSLETGGVTWSGTYRFEGAERLVLRTEKVLPVEGHASDCIGAEEVYRWSRQKAGLLLAFEGEPCNLNRRWVLTSFPWRPSA